MKIIKKGLYEYHKLDSGFVVINSSSNSIEFELLYLKNKKKLSKKSGCLFAILALLISSELDYDSGVGRVSKLIFKKDSFNTQTQINRVRKGVEVIESEDELGSIKFKKRELICKYTIKVKGDVLGELVSKSMSYSEVMLNNNNNNNTLAKLTKSSKMNSNKIGTIDLFEDLSRDEFKVLVAAILLWV